MASNRGIIDGGNCEEGIGVEREFAQGEGLLNISSSEVYASLCGVPVLTTCSFCEEAGGVKALGGDLNNCCGEVATVTKFDIPEVAKGWILQSFGRKVKNWRARIKELYHDPSLSLKEQISSRPKQVQKKQWKKLVKYWNKEKSKLVSEKTKANRAKKKMVQVTGKKSYARVREELKASKGQDPSRLEMFRACFSKDGTTKNLEASNAIAQMQQHSSNLPEGSIDKPGPDDVFSKVMGNDRNGDAVMYGLGVRAADVWGVIPSRSACHRENIQLKSQCEELTSTVVQLRAQVSEM
ncbi:uncharacterized protein LOC110896998 [Helianthus annuus]|uniref:uncharacterized protein LOC110896998 n=1 Tax=Helianthus annuus TaxID=4232 RepID=UPI001652F02E|nr:uncharacterized protein LOC110896998 [Helianthus annuus]